MMSARAPRLRLVLSDDAMAICRLAAGASPRSTQPGTRSKQTRSRRYEFPETGRPRKRSRKPRWVSTQATAGTTVGRISDPN